MPGCTGGFAVAHNGNLTNASPLLAVPLAAKKLSISQPTVQKSLDHLARLGIVKEVTGKRRSRLYEYSRYLRILDEGTEPLRR